MTYNIYSLGNSSFLQKVFNGVAMITGTNDFITCCTIGVLFGILLVALNTVLTGKGPDITGLVLCLVVWVFMFGSTTSVNIHDVYNDNDRKVDNVPTGVALCGWAISNIGYGITEFMETAFQAPTASSTLTGGGSGDGGKFADALYKLNQITLLGYDDLFLKGLDDTGTNYDYEKTVQNYIADCTFYKILRGDISQQNISTQSYTRALQFDSKVYYTRVYLGAANGEDKSCSEAWTDIQTKLANSLSQIGAGGSLDKYLAKLFGQGHFSSASSTLLSSTSAQMWMTDAVQALGLDEGALDKIVATSLYDRVYAKGIAQGYQSVYDTSSAAMVMQARSQRNAQWAAEQTMFFDTMRPMMTFIEGFTYAITPFAGFLMMMGLWGVKLIGKYFMLLAWTQSWIPVTSIVNLYIYESAREGLQRFTYGYVGDHDISSFYALNDILELTKNYIGIGGMFAAAVPLLTLFLFTGSIYGLTTLTGRMSGQDVIDEKQIAPSLASNQALANVQPMANIVNQRSERTGYSFPTISVGDNLAENMAQLQSQAFSKQESMIGSFSQAVATNASNINTAGLTHSLTQAFGATSNQNKETIESITQSNKALNSFSMTADQKSLIDGAIGLGFSAQEVIKIAGDAGIKGSNSKAFASAVSQSVDDVRANGLSNAQTSALSDAITNQLVNSHGNSQSFGMTSSIASSLQHQASETKQAVDSWSQAKTATRQYGVQSNVNLSEFSSAIERHGLKDEFMQKFANLRQNASEAELRQLKALEGQWATSGSAGETMVAAKWMSDLQGSRGIEGDMVLQDMLGKTGYGSGAPVNAPSAAPDMNLASSGGVGGGANGAGSNISAIQSATESNPNALYDSSKGIVKTTNGGFNASVNSSYVNKQNKILSDGFESNGATLDKRGVDANTILEHAGRGYLSNNLEMSSYPNSQSGINAVVDKTVDRFNGNRTVVQRDGEAAGMVNQYVRDFSTLYAKDQSSMNFNEKSIGTEGVNYSKDMEALDHRFASQFATEIMKSDNTIDEKTAYARGMTLANAVKSELIHGGQSAYGNSTETINNGINYLQGAMNMQKYDM